MVWETPGTGGGRAVSDCIDFVTAGAPRVSGGGGSASMEEDVLGRRTGEVGREDLPGTRPPASNTVVGKRFLVNNTHHSL